MENEGAGEIKERARDLLQGDLQKAHCSLSHAHNRTAFFLLNSFKFDTVNCSNRCWCAVLISTPLLLRAAWSAFAALFGWCCLCDVVLVSAGRNVLDSMPPTQCPPTRGRLCIYTSGSSRSPQSLCSFKFLPCIHPSALFLSIIGFSGVFLLQPNKHANTHTHAHISFPQGA